MVDNVCLEKGAQDPESPQETPGNGQDARSHLEEEDRGAGKDKMLEPWGCRWLLCSLPILSHSRWAKLVVMETEAESPGKGRRVLHVHHRDMSHHGPHICPEQLLRDKILIPERWRKGLGGSLPQQGALVPPSPS